MLTVCLRISTMAAAMLELAFVKCKEKMKNDDDSGMRSPNEFVIVDGKCQIGDTLNRRDILGRDEVYWWNATELSDAAEDNPGAKPLSAFFIGTLDAEDKVQSMPIPPGADRLTLFIDSSDCRSPVYFSMLHKTTHKPLIPLVPGIIYVFGLNRCSSQAPMVNPGRSASAGDGGAPTDPKPPFSRSKPQGLLVPPGKTGTCTPCISTSKRGSGRVSLTGGRSGQTGAPFMPARCYRHTQIYAAGSNTLRISSRPEHY